MQPTTTLLSILGETIQTFGVLGITLLFLMLFRVLSRTYFLRWGQAWLAMLVALMSLHLVFSFPVLSFLEPLYFAGEYIFAALLWLGVATFPQREVAVRRLIWPIAAIIAVWSLCLTYSNPYFGNRFSLHAYVFTASLLPAWMALYRLTLPISYVWAKKAALVALALLMLNFVLCASSLFSGPYVSELVHNCYFAYQSIFDLIFEVLLAFSLLIIAAVNMKGELERANRVLQSERDNMSMLAHQDALTGCFNRHALGGLSIGNRSGLVVMLDINDLKPINDNYGHQLGDQAICRVAHTVKAHLRAQDYLCRYGGDEFVIVSFDLSSREAEQRMQEIQQALKALPPLDPLHNALSISWGIQAFVGEQAFEAAIDAADGLMYKQKLAFHETSSI